MIDLIKLEFSEAHKMPSFVIPSGGKFVKAGLTNEYFDYLIELFYRAPIHAAIIKNKVAFVAGSGVRIAEYSTEVDRVKAERIADDIAELALQLAFDYEIFNSFAVNLYRSPLTGKVIKYEKEKLNFLRIDASLENAIKSTEWTRYTSLKETFTSPYNRIPKGAVELPLVELISNESGIYWHRDSNSALKVYPLPTYAAGMAAIETDAEIKNFNLNNIRTGFSAGMMINLFNGEPSPEAKRQIEAAIRRKVSGTDNAGEILINYATDKEHAAEAIPLRSNDLAEQYLNLEQSVRDAIMSAHQATSPMLFGIRVPGTLGGRSEYIEAYEAFNNIYANQRRRTLEKFINELIAEMGINAIFEINNIPPISTNPSFSDIKDSLTKNEIRAAGGYAELEEDGEEAETFSAENADDVLFAYLSTMGIDDCEGDEGEAIESFEHATQLEAAYFAQFDNVADRLDTEQKRVYDLLKEKKPISINVIAEKAGISRERALSIIEDLQKRNIINAKVIESRGKIMITPIVIETEIKQPSRGVEIRYKYTGPEDEKNREFCAELLKLNKIYTLNEIKAMNNGMKEFNTDVFSYRGGWYTIPNTNGERRRPSCRHTWRQKVVKI
jgi:DNA-binding Lrp family transcriptional regulator